MNRQTMMCGALAGAVLVALGSVAAGRTWTDSSGQFHVDGEFAGSKDGTVTIKTSDGKAIKIPLDKLSKDDQKFVETAPNPTTMASPIAEFPKDDPKHGVASAAPVADPVSATIDFVTTFRELAANGKDEIGAMDTDARKTWAREKLVKSLGKETNGKVLAFRFPIKNVASAGSQESRLSVDWPLGIDKDHARPTTSFTAPLNRAEAVRVEPGDILLISGKAILVTGKDGRRSKAHTGDKEVEVIVVSGYAIALKECSFKIEPKVAIADRGPASPPALKADGTPPVIGK